MLPALRAGQIVVGRPKSSVCVGDVVVMRHGGLEKIKRVAKMRSDAVYVLGDNAAASTDSRSFGWLPIGAIVAKVVWPKV